jgi:hypothetical protein
MQRLFVAIISKGSSFDPSVLHLYFDETFGMLTYKVRQVIFPSGEHKGSVVIVCASLATKLSE